MGSKLGRTERPNVFIGCGKKQKIDRMQRRALSYNVLLPWSVGDIVGSDLKEREDRR